MMIKKILKITSAFLLCLFIYTCVAAIASWPGEKFLPLNVIFMAFTVAVGTGQTKIFRWFLLLSLVIIDFFSVLPFGLYSLSFLTGLIIVEKFTVSIFSDRSILPIAATSFTGMLVFRLLFSFFSGAYGMYNGLTLLPIIKNNASTFLTESFFTAAVTAISFLIIKSLLKKIAPGRFIIYGKI